MHWEGAGGGGELTAFMGMQPSPIASKMVQNIYPVTLEHFL